MAGPRRGRSRPSRRGRGRTLERTEDEASLLRSANAEDTLVISAADPGRRLAFELVRARLRAQLTLEPVGHDRSEAELEVAAPLFPAFSRSLPRTALARLHDLCQTAAAV